MRIGAAGCLIALVSGVAVLPISEAAAQRRDGRQQVRATSATRVCTYPEDRLTTAGRREYSILVGRGEPCPVTVPNQQQQQATAPAFAQLAEQGRRGNRVICTYAHLGRRYEVSIDVGLSCPLTPALR